MAESPSKRAGSPVLPLLSGADHDGAPLHARVYRQMREHILRGALRPGARLPSARMLAADLGVSRNTIEAAVTQLRAEGFVVRRVGSGTFVAAAVPDLVAPDRPGRRARARSGERGGRASAPPAPPPPPRLSSRGRSIAQLGATELEEEARANPCATDVRGFPVRTWNRLLARRARQVGAAALLPADPAGVPRLRQAIADHLRLTRGVRCDAAQVIVVNSTQQAVDLAARLLLEPGATALVEDPGYPSARAALAAAGASVRGVPVDRGGLVTDALPDEPGARLLYLTPSHQFPLGVTMALARRLAVLRWAAATGAWVLEDDYDSEFRYDGRPLASLQGLDPAGRTLYVGTFNKVLFPAIRLAYLVVPPALAADFIAARRVLDGFSPTLLQLSLADFITDGHFTAHLRQARQRYAARRDALVRGVAAEWGDAVRLGPSDTGLHLVAHLRAGVSDIHIARAAPAGGIGIAPLSRYYLHRKPSPGLLLTYGAATLEEIGASIRRLAPLVARERR
ncbi:MAG TPA: PLP-dependent aminotransferase family protein [Gemmatimonadaceae bacterium]